MKIGGFDVGGKIPNLALMKASTFHKQMGDDFQLGRAGEINYISCIHTKKRHIVQRLIESLSNAIAGGPGWDVNVKLPPEIDSQKPDYELYGIDYGLGRLTQGCPGKCEFCVVPAIEGDKVKTVGRIADIVNPKSEFVVLMDSNILASDDYTNHFQEIREMGLTVNFCQGLDIRYINEFSARQLATLKLSNMARTTNQVHFAWDNVNIEPFIRSGLMELEKAGIKPYRVRFYMIVGFNSTWEEDWYRFETLKNLGAEPYVMKYENCSQKLRDFARYVNTLTYKKYSWDDYLKYVKRQGQEVIGF